MTTTFEQKLLDAMLRMLQHKGIPAVSVPAYRECSYNIGYCSTCNDLVTEVRVYYNLSSGSPRYWDYFGGLGELIRKLTDEPEERVALEAMAVRESEDERWDHFEAHSLNEALAMVPNGEAGMSQPPGTVVVVDGRELIEVHPAAFDMVRDDVLSWGLRRWQADRTPPDPVGWRWLGRASGGEDLYWLPVPAVPASPRPSGDAA